jgi:hypothetical protein
LHRERARTTAPHTLTRAYAEPYRDAVRSNAGGVIAASFVLCAALLSST